MEARREYAATSARTNQRTNTNESMCVMMDLDPVSSASSSDTSIDYYKEQLLRKSPLALLQHSPEANDSAGLAHSTSPEMNDERRIAPNCRQSDGMDFSRVNLASEKVHTTLNRHRAGNGDDDDDVDDDKAMPIESAKGYSVGRKPMQRKPPPSLEAEEAKQILLDTESANDSLAQGSRLSSRMKRLSLAKIGKKLKTMKETSSVKYDSPNIYPDESRRSGSMTPHACSPSISSIEHHYSTDDASMNPTLPKNDATAPHSVNPFWKFHVLHFGKDLYLTTNPGAKHVYCRHAPGFYVEVKGLSQDGRLDGKDGFVLIFRDNADLLANKKSNKTSNNSNNRQAFMQITKKPENEGGFFTLKIPKNTYVDDDGIVVKYQDMTNYSGVSFPQEISQQQFPYNDLRCKHKSSFENYEVQDFWGNMWNVGSIPRVRVSKTNQVKAMMMRNRRKDMERNEEDDIKMIGKSNVYFHQNFISRGGRTRYKEPDARKIYYQDGESHFPPVLCVFRPFKKLKMAEKISKSMKNHEQIGSKYYRLEEDKGAELNSVTYDTTRKYYRASDGLYSDEGTLDDTPDENKFGWITVYEDRDVFGGGENRGMFDLVVGMTLAVGFSNSLKR
ncbi:uncharacterized protein LODBEIA_P24320 [Lodderomyces beijingensis]|uniref:Uncharacterized protein n=1 Tax=Lodderomyces beijingensis TaxID=1775926 RepID=A0ABP0ZKN4_9ASCO